MVVSVGGRWLAVVALLVMWAAPVIAQAPVSAFLAPDAKWEELPKGGKVFGEGVVAAKDGKIYVSDITATPNIDDNPGGTIYKFDPATGATTKHLEPSGLSNGLHVDKAGDLLIAQYSGPKGLRRIARQNLATGEVKILAESYQGKKLNGPNDLTSDAQGRIYFTDALYGANDPMELPNAIYRLDPSGTLTQLSTDVFRGNGIEVSPDGRTLYVSACNVVGALKVNPNGPSEDKFGITAGGIVAYELKDGVVSNPKLIHKRDICVDGMTLDSDGNLYVTHHNGNRQAPKSEILVLDGTGKVLAEIPVPPGAALTTNAGFGRGADAGMLYVTSAAPWGLYRIKTTKRGHYFE